MYYATVSILSNCFIENNKKSTAKVKCEQRKGLKEEGGIGVLLRRNRDGGTKSCFTEGFTNFTGEFDITKICLCNLGREVAETQM